MKIGYARTSTADQTAGMEAQLAELERQGCDKTFKEHISSVAKRIELEAAIDYLRDGDALIVTKLDRLARSVPHLLAIVERVKAKGASIEIGNLGRLDDTATGKLMVTMLGAIAALARDDAGASARRHRRSQGQGQVQGASADRKAAATEVRRLVADGVSKSEIPRQLGIHRASVQRILAGP